MLRDLALQQQPSAV